MAQTHAPLDASSSAKGGEERLFLVFWWLDQTPFVARFQDEEEADRAARVRNSLVVELRGRDLQVPRVVDYYRRDEGGRPLPAKWMELTRRAPPKVFHGRLPV